MTLLEAVSAAKRGEKVRFGSRCASLYCGSLRWLDKDGVHDSYVVVDDCIMDGWSIEIDPRRFSIEEAIPLMRSGRWMRPAGATTSWFAFRDGRWFYKNEFAQVTPPMIIKLDPYWIDCEWEMQP